MLEKILVLDLECTCWEKQPPDGQTQEIIEIGLCMLDTFTLERSQKHSIMVKPERSAVSAFCTQLTTITPEEANKGVPFSEALHILTTEFGAAATIWASFGDFDRKQLECQCRDMGFAYPFKQTHLNVKVLSSLMLGLKRPLGMDGTLQKMGLPLEGIHHRGADDAWNIALILKHILLKWRT